MQVNLDSAIGVGLPTKGEAVEGELLSKKIVIYLAGAVPKNKEDFDDRFYWTIHHMDELRRYLPQYEMVLLNPAFNDSNLANQEHVFGRDMEYVLSSNVVLVDARNKKGLGVGAEMMIAKMHKIPVVCWAPTGSHYNKDIESLGIHFLHPFVAALSDAVVETVEEGAKWIDTWIKEPGSFYIKDRQTIQEAIAAYQSACKK